MSEVEVARKVRSVCEKMGMGARSVELLGWVNVGDRLVRLLPDECVDNRTGYGFIPNRGEVFVVVQLSGDGIPKCVSTQRDLTAYLFLEKMAFPEDYEAAYKGTQQQPEKEEKAVEITEYQFEWILENADKKPMKDLSAEELKALYDALYSGDDMVIVEVLNNVKGTWHEVGKHSPWWDSSYRVMRKVKDTPLNIAWEWVDPKWNYAAMDEDRRVFLYADEPYIKLSEYLYWSLRSDVQRYNPPALTTDGIDWKRSLTKRP
jgi:hypothetical protein